jgi:transposase
MLLPQLSSLLIDEVVEQGSTLLIRARTQTTVVACPQCGQPTERVHAYHRRRLADVAPAENPSAHVAGPARLLTADA